MIPLKMELNKPSLAWDEFECFCFWEWMAALGLGVHQGANGFLSSYICLFNVFFTAVELTSWGGYWVQNDDTQTHTQGPVSRKEPI